MQDLIDILKSLIIQKTMLIFVIMKTDKTQDLINQGVVLPLMEEFYTLQGEGFHKGKAAYFIRLAGCDVGCHWCDVKESWDASIHRAVPITKMVDKASAHPGKIVVVTGGEPTMYNLAPLTKALQSKGCQTHIETSGAHPLTGLWDWVCLSPKKRKLPTDKAYRSADELKVVIYNRHDFIFAEEQAQKVGVNCRLYLQPEWSVREKIMPQLVEYVLLHPEWQVTLQSHKYLAIP